MFVRPIRPEEQPLSRPEGAPLLRGLLSNSPSYAADRQARAAAVPPAPVAAGGTEIADRLTRLGDMAREGLLTPEEFAAAKSRLLGG
ncbi:MULTISPECIES: SHOCT domain-containing protein [unclassified Streptomyces]|uniref:SHOCT domain-containing protein n=1 Tax=unclassified Streptomyces TaxID=2593676 RepID=UPI0038044AA5